VLLSRLLRPGERVDVDGQRPLRVRVGNVAGTEVVWLGRPVPLQDIQRSNVADLQLP
jgi:cytoskeleton protein RodZ